MPTATTDPAVGGVSMKDGEGEREDVLFDVAVNRGRCRGVGEDDEGRARKNR